MPRHVLPPGPGRPKGTPNKTPRAVKAALEEAFERMGGVAALVTWGKTNPAAFYPIWAKLLPVQMQHTGADGASIAHDVTVRFVRPT